MNLYAVSDDVDDEGIQYVVAESLGDAIERWKKRLLKAWEPTTVAVVCEGDNLILREEVGELTADADKDCTTCRMIETLAPFTHCRYWPECVIDMQFTKHQPKEAKR